MKLRDSGMPDEVYWESLFDVPLILARLHINSNLQDVAELGCGYGTFTLPVAAAIRGTLYTFDIEPEMVLRTHERAAQAGLGNVICRELDVMERGFDISNPVDAVLLFNILHCHDPGRLIAHATDALRPGGLVLIIHWRYDSATPRGPALDIRPQPGQIVRWAEQGGRLEWSGESIDLPPWHYGLVFKRD
jgi:SAM-dependent methyltransferase